MFIICMSSMRVIMGVKGRAKQKAFSNFLYLDRQGASAFHPLPSSSCSPDKASLRMAHPFTHLALLQVASYHTEIEPELFIIKHSRLHISLIVRLVKSFSMKASHILFFTLSTLNIVSEKFGGAATSLS
jgi:hypothetical protein